MLPLWVLVLQAVIPLVKTVLDMVKAHAPAQDAPQVHKDLYTSVVGSIETCHGALCDAHARAKA